MNKEETVKIKVKLPLITDEDIRVLDNNFGYIVNEVIKAQCKERELALLQLIIKKQQQVLIDIRELVKNNSIEIDGVHTEVCCSGDNILQIIDKVLKGDK